MILLRQNYLLLNRKTNEIILKNIPYNESHNKIQLNLLDFYFSSEK